MSNPNPDYLPYEERVPDVQYQQLLRRIRDNGRSVGTIHSITQGIPSKKVRGHMLSFDLENGFPLITERNLKGGFRIAINELVAFLNGARTSKELHDFGVPFWDIWVTEEQCSRFGLRAGDLGPGSYGPAWTHFPHIDGRFIDQIESVVRQIREKPYLRTHVINPWIPGFALQDSGNDRKVVVAPCHGLVHFHVDEKTREIEVVHWQRSADVPVGLAFNMVQYAALGMMVGQVTGYKMVGLTHQTSDTHIYHNQWEDVERLLEREARRLPTVRLETKKTELRDIRSEDFVLEDYHPHPGMKIPTPV